MTAKIVGFVSRADANLRAPRSVSYNITPANGGVAVHYGGPAQNISSHAECITRWRGWQDYHMDRHGWVDIAYSGGFCQHGYAFAGRGFGTRTAANGTNDGNQNFYAYTWIGGDGETPTRDALNALDWWVVEARKAGGAGRQVVPHQHFKSTACPGSYLVNYSKSLHLKDPSLPPTPVMEDGMPLLTRINNGNAVYQVCGRYLFPLSSPKQAEVIRKLSGIKVTDWRDLVGNISTTEASAFTIVRNDLNS